MIAPDGTVFPNHHRFVRIEPQKRIDYMLLWGENGPKHADAWVEFSEVEGGTEVTLGMAMATAKEWAEAKGFGAEALGLQTRCKLARFIGADQSIHTFEHTLAGLFGISQTARGAAPPPFSCGKRPSSISPRPRPWPMPCARPSGGRRRSRS